MKHEDIPTLHIPHNPLLCGHRGLCRQTSEASWNCRYDKGDRKYRDWLSRMPRFHLPAQRDKKFTSL